MFETGLICGIPPNMVVVRGVGFPPGIVLGLVGGYPPNTFPLICRLFLQLVFMFQGPFPPLGILPFQGVDFPLEVEPKQVLC